MHDNGKDSERVREICLLPAVATQITSAEHSDVGRITEQSMCEG